MKICQLLFLLSFSILTSCHRSHRSDQKAEAEKDSSVKCIDTVSLQSQLLNALFPESDIISNDSSAHIENLHSSKFQSKHVHWNPSSRECAEFNSCGTFFNGEQGSVFTLIDTIITGTGSSSTAVLAAYPVGNAFDGAVSAPSIGMAEFKSSNGSISISRIRKHVVHAGSSGELPDFQQVQIDAQTWGVMYEQTTIGQGLEESRSILIAPSGSSFDTVLSVVTASNNFGQYDEGTDSAWEMQASVSFPADGSAQIHFRGKQPDSTGAIVPADFIEKYHWNGTRFEMSN